MSRPRGSDSLKIFRNKRGTAFHCIHIWYIQFKILSVWVEFFGEDSNLWNEVLPWTKYVFISDDPKVCIYYYYSSIVVVVDTYLRMPLCVFNLEYLRAESLVEIDRVNRAANITVLVNLSCSFHYSFNTSTPILKTYVHSLRQAPKRP